MGEVVKDETLGDSDEDSDVEVVGKSKDEIELGTSDEAVSDGVPTEVSFSTMVLEVSTVATELVIDEDDT